MPPSAPTVKSWGMRPIPESPDMKNSSSPSGVQSQSTSLPGWCETRKGTPPSIGMTYKSRSPS